MAKVEQELAIQKAREKIVKLALAEVGYHEKATNAQLDDPTANSGSNNWNKYAAEIDAYREQGLNFYNGRKNIGPVADWCDIFSDRNFIKAFGINLAMQVLYQPSDSCGAGCEYSAGYFRAAGAWLDRSGSPTPGDQIFFGPKKDETHTGIAVDVDDVYVWTVEGNSGNAVQRKKYRRDDSYIAGYGVPNYAVVAHLFVEQEPTPGTPIADDVEPTNERDRLLAILDDRWIGTYRDLPDWARPEVMEMIKLGALKGTKPVEDPEDTAIGATLSFVRSLIIALRTIKALAVAADKVALAEALEAAAATLKQ